MAFLDQNVCCQSWKAGFTAVGPTSIAANRQDAPQLDELDGCDELLHNCLTVVDTMSVAAIAGHVYFRSVVVLEARQAHVVGQSAVGSMPFLLPSSPGYIR